MDDTKMVYVFRDGRYEIVPGGVVHVRWNRGDYPAFQARVPVTGDEGDEIIRQRAYDLLMNSPAADLGVPAPPREEQR